MKTCPTLYLTTAYIALLLFLTVESFAAPPATITYQGYLTNPSGAPVKSPVAMTFSLYDTSTGGSPLWSEHQADVALTNGVYSVLIGSVNAINVPFDTTYYLGVAVGSDPEMNPRQALSAVPYSFRAGIANTLGQTCSDGEMLKYSAATSGWSCSTVFGVLGPVGPQGVAGANGTNGAAGTNGLNGKTVLNGAVDPATEGTNGDFYINTVSSRINTSHTEMS